MISFLNLNYDCFSFQAVYQAEVERFMCALTNGAGGGSTGSTLPAEIGGVKVAGNGSSKSVLSLETFF
jgi:hypothetical protein